MIKLNTVTHFVDIPNLYRAVVSVNNANEIPELQTKVEQQMEDFMWLSEVQKGPTFFLIHLVYFGKGHPTAEENLTAITNFFNTL